MKILVAVEVLTPGKRGKKTSIRDMDLCSQNTHVAHL